MPRPKFRVSVIANNIAWPSLQAKLDAVGAFYASVCDFDFSIKHTQFVPPFSTIPNISPLSEVQEDWYDTYVSGPNALSADIVILIVSPDDHRFTPTPMGIMTQNNIGPWEITVFATGESDHLYVDGQDFGDSFTHYTIHELSHAFYAMHGLYDRTHEHFPVGQNPYTDHPEAVLEDFAALDNRSFILTFLGRALSLGLSALNILAKQRVRQVADTPAPSQAAQNGSGSTQNPKPAPTSFPAKIIAWANAIAKGEGALPSSMNPGNLKYSALTESFGAIKGRAALDGGYFCQFDTQQAGFNALCSYLVLAAQDQLAAYHSPSARTLEGFTKIYAGNPPTGYIRGIEQALDIPGTTDISTFLS